MTKEELYSRIIQLVPVERKNPNVGFQEVLNNSFESYIGLLKEYKESQSDDIQENEIEDICSVCTQISKTIEYQYRGLHYKAFNEFYELMDKNIKYLTSYYGDNTPFLYRMRIFEVKRSITYKDMFHIQLQKRGMASTQRYSVPGYPCLYMGESVYTCWEELGRPALYSCMVSRLLTRITSLIDLRVPTEKEFDDSFISVLLRFPLIISCMIPVLKENEKDSFKPEYIIPQLLMEFIIEGFPDEEITDINKQLLNPQLDVFCGIRYTSVHKNKDFNFPDDKFDNVVVPVIKPLSKSDYCPVLSEMFEITSPTCDEYERNKGNSPESYMQKAGYSEEETKNRNYEVSVFGIMEESLKNKEEFSLFRMM